MASSSRSGVPPGFRFHPTEEELLQYYLRKKVAMERTDLEVIREVDLNKVEPWELHEKCAMGSGPEEWYFFSRRDRKYPTGLRMNRATVAGFWKATGRDKFIRSNEETLGMRKTLVFYKGRAPHGQKTDWIMHEFRLHGDTTEDGWVVCCVFKKKTLFKDATMEPSALYLGHHNPNMEAVVAKAAAVGAENRRMGGVVYKHGFSVHPPLYSSLSVGGGFTVASGEFTMMDSGATNAIHNTAATHSVDQIPRHSLGEMEPCGWGWGKKITF